MGASSSSSSSSSGSPSPSCSSADADSALMHRVCEAVCSSGGESGVSGHDQAMLSGFRQQFDSAEECVAKTVQGVRETLCDTAGLDAPPPPLDKVVQMGMAAAISKSSRVHTLLADQVPAGISPEEYCEREVKRNRME